MGKWREDVADRFALPPESLNALPRVTLSGDRQLLVENYRKVLSFSGELLLLDGGRLRLQIRGEGLELLAMEGDALLVRGKIFGVEME